MKLEFLASVLKKDAAELESTLNLSNQDEVPEDKLKSIFENHFNDVRITALSEGKRQGEGKAKKEVLNEAEKQLKGQFDLGGATFAEMITELDTKLKSKTKVETDDKALTELKLWKQKYAEKETEMVNMQNQFRLIQTKEQIKSKFADVFGMFEFASPKVEQIAFDELVDGKKWTITETDAYFEQGDKLVTNPTKFIEEHLSLFGKPKGKAINQNRPQANGTSYGNDLETLQKAFNSAKTIEEKQEIISKMEQLENK